MNIIIHSKLYQLAVDDFVSVHVVIGSVLDRRSATVEGAEDRERVALAVVEGEALGILDEMELAGRLHSDAVPLQELFRDRDVDFRLSTTQDRREIG